MREQTAFSPIPPRASRGRTVHTSEDPTIRRAGSTIGIHPEDEPRTYSPRQKVLALPDITGDYEEPPRTTTSVIRRRYPVSPAAQQVPVIKPRKHWLFYAGLIGVTVTTTILGMTTLPPFLQRWSDDRTYSYPRTYQTTANVGHGSKQTPLSQFIATNHNGVIQVYETSGESPDKLTSHLYIIATLTGGGADLVPATLSFADSNGDGKLDMEVFVNNTLYVWYNDGKEFTEHL